MFTSSTFTDDFDDDFGQYPNDCANFTSQCINAGCAGLCENCGPGQSPTNWTGWDPTSNLVCWNYRNLEPTELYCYPCPSGNHQVTSVAESQGYWFMGADNDWEVAYATALPIPVDVTRGWFVRTRRLGEVYHTSFVEGEEFGGEAPYYAHNNNRCGEHNLNWLCGGSTLVSAYFFGPIREFSSAEEFPGKEEYSENM